MKSELDSRKQLSLVLDETYLADTAKVSSRLTAIALPYM